MPKFSPIASGTKPNPAKVIPRKSYERGTRVIRLCFKLRLYAYTERGQAEEYHFEGMLTRGELRSSS